MNDLGRKPLAVSGSARGKQIVAGVIIGIAIVLDLIAAMLSSSRVHAQTVGWLYGAALGLLLVGLIWMIAKRKRS